MFLIVPYATALAPGCEAALRGLSLPNLERLLARLALFAADEADEFTLSPPHERALARLRGLSAPDGCLPWAALSIADGGGPADDHARAFITPCHWQIGADKITLLEPAALQLAESESRTVLDLVAPYFAEDGITLEYRDPVTWLASGELFRNLPTASLDRVSGRNLDLWMPDGKAARPLRRLQTEVQMLLYTHAVTDERNERGLPAVNAFWASGSGALAGGSRPAPAGLLMPQALREAALHDDWDAWREAWKTVDASDCARALSALDAGEPVTLTLCGERAALDFASAPVGAATRWMRRAKGLFARRPTLQDWAARL